MAKHNPLPAYKSWYTAKNPICIVDSIPSLKVILKYISATDHESQLIKSPNSNRCFDLLTRKNNIRNNKENRIKTNFKCNT